ncbi:MAG: SURF1 family protein [Jiangellales bacterium]
MLRFLLTPRWLALHVATIAAIAGTLVLGSWQMRAYAEQEERDRVAAANLAEDAPTAPIDEVAPAGRGLDVDAVSRPVSVSGRYDPSATLLLPGRELDGRTGWYVVTPLVSDDQSVTPVLRGWVADRFDPAVDPPTGGVDVTGSVQALESDADAAPVRPDSLAPDEVAALTSVALFRTYPYPPATARQMLLVLTGEEPSASVAPERVPVAEAAASPVGVSAWRHLSYAWQWWLFAAAAVAFWVAFVRSGYRDEKAHAAARSDEPLPTTEERRPAPR